MKKNDIIIRITVLLLVISGFCSCVDDDHLSATGHLKENQFILKLPEKRVVDITTRSEGTISIKSILAAVIRSNGVVFEYVSSGITLEANGIIKCTLNSLSPKANEKVYFFCNVANQSDIVATTEADLLRLVKCDSGTEDVMYGVRETTNSTEGNIQVDLKHSLANIKVTIDKDAYTVKQLLVCDVPEEGFASGIKYETSEVKDVTFEDVNASMFIVPRPNNDMTDVPTTFLLMELNGKGWYRMDFYHQNNSTVLAPGISPELLQIQPDVFYHFNITSVRNDGYTTPEEARNNIGSNIIYNLDVDDNASSSNGQYALLTDKDEILLYPNYPGGIINISALIHSGEITTYTAKLFSSNGHIKFKDLTGDQMNLIKTEDGRLTTENSDRPIEFSSTGAWTQGDYLEITLGNIKKKIPFRLLTANSYLFDCSKSDKIKIPYQQANLDGTIRIRQGDNITCELLWADHPGASFRLTPRNDEGWMEVESGNSSFFGNAVIVAKLGQEIKWSWHLWCMDNSDNSISYDEKIGLYRYNNTQSYCDYEWMDRNLGAYNKKYDGDPGTRGLIYQWGRKDPFYAGGVFPAYVQSNIQSARFPEDTLYTGSGKKYIMWDTTTDQAGVFPEINIPLYRDLPSSSNDKEILDLSIKEPFVMLAVPGSSGGWRVTLDKYSWTTVEGKKAMYDPCPVGWRVPVGVDTNGPWYELSINARLEASDYGMVWADGKGGKIYYPFVPERGFGLIPPVKTHSPTEGWYKFYNRQVGMLWADARSSSFTFPGLTSFSDVEGLDGNLQAAYSTEIRYAYYASPVMAASVRCVKE